MAILFSRIFEGRTHEVRSAGASVRLYVDGVLHTQFNPRTVWTGDIWDLLVLPALALPPESVQRVLLLGLGGGAAVHLLRACVRPREIVAVDLCRSRIALAKRFFGVAGRDLSVVHADAVDFVGARASKEVSAPFNLIIDDLFGESEDREPARAVPATVAWGAALLRLLHPSGALVMNYADRAELRNAACLNSMAFRRRFVGGAATLVAPRSQNVIAALYSSLPEDAVSASVALRAAITTARRGFGMGQTMRRYAGKVRVSELASGLMLGAA